jgi:UPF0716 protein FxsA
MRAGTWLFLIFFGVPIIEIALFVKLGGLIGLWPTLGLVVLSAMVGATVMRSQGLQALARLQASLETGGDPVGPIAHGALILIAGVLLLTPGFFTDTVGLLLLIPPVRAQLIRWGASRVTVKAATFVRPGRSGPAPDVIDADYEIVDEEMPRRSGRSGWTRPH